MATNPRTWNRWVTIMFRWAPVWVVEAGAPFDRERVGHVDLHVGDVLAVPDRLGQGPVAPNATVFMSWAPSNCGLFRRHQASRPAG